MSIEYKSQITHKIWSGTLTKLRMIYALTGESMSSIIDRLITAELEQLQSQENK